MWWRNDSWRQFRQSAGNGADTYAHARSNTDADAYTCSTPDTQCMRRDVDGATFQPERLPSRSQRTARGTPISHSQRSMRIRRPSSTTSGRTIGLHADFGSGLYNGSNIGIPYVIVDGTQAGVNITAQYSDESDPGPMPIPANALIEGYPNPGSGDRHVLVLDSANCFLYELYSSYPNTDGSWSTGSAAVWDLLSNEQRPWTWTSADAAGLPIFPGLIRYDEVAAGQIQHAIRFTLQNSRAAFVPPASHLAATTSNANAAPMGMRMRLKASFDVSGYSAANQVILNAMKKYGIIMADNGSSMYISGAPDSRWDNSDLHNLGNVTAGNFEVVQMSPIYTSANVPQGAAPTSQQLHGFVDDGERGNAGNAELVGGEWRVRDHFAASGSSARCERDSDAERDDDVYAVCDESVRTNDGDGHGDGELVADPP